jgi:LTXXQ motif family protein
MVEASGMLKGRKSKLIFFATREPVMKLASIPAALCTTAMLAMAQATSALAQDAHQHTEATPPAAASPATPASPSVPSGMMQATEMMQMMQMMQKMHSGAMPRMAMMGASLMTPGGAIQNVEGHIAFLKAELKITDAQQKQWDQFADALRTNATALSAAYSAMMSRRMGGGDKKMPPMARLEQQEKLQTLELEALKRSRTALDGLNAVLSDEQKQRLDQLI